MGNNDNETPHNSRGGFVFIKEATGRAISCQKCQRQEVAKDGQICDKCKNETPHNSRNSYVEDKKLSSHSCEFCKNGMIDSRCGYRQGNRAGERYGRKQGYLEGHEAGYDKALAEKSASPLIWGIIISFALGAAFGFLVWVFI